MSSLIEKIKTFIAYCTTGVWEDARSTVWVRLLKTVNLAVRSFLDRGLQLRSMSLTYSTVLAIVPALAMILAIGRGFGLQDLITSSLYAYLPSQSKALSTAFTFVDSYLKEASSGVFVGVGIVFLLWTVISLLSSIEDAFNTIWDVRHDRNIYQKLTDYIAICLMIPILMICSSGLSIFMATTLQNNIHIALLTPVINMVLEFTPVILVWMAFSLSFWLIPNTKVNFKYAAISGAICALSFQILQMLFFSGQIYVSKYNAIYGSFAFLPLLLIWLQLSWLIALAGCVLTYSLQNVFTFDFLGDVKSVSPNYTHKLDCIVMAVIVQAYLNGKTPPSDTDISSRFDIPIRIASHICDKLRKAGLIYTVLVDPEDTRTTGYTPSTDPENITVTDLLKRLDAEGQSDFIPRFGKIFGSSLQKLDEVMADAYPLGRDLLLKDLRIPE